MNRLFLRLISALLLGALLCVSGHAQNYRVKAERYERGIYSPETNPPSVRYAIIDLGPDIEPIRLSNSGHVLCQPAKAGKLQSRWYQGQFQELTGGDDSLLVGTLDMNDAGTVVGSILEYKTGSADGLPPCPDSEYGWYRNPSYGIRRAAAWYAGSGGASLLDQPEYAFKIYDCTVPHGPPYSGSSTFGSAWTIDDSGHIYGEAEAAYAEHQNYEPPPDDIYLPTVVGVAYSGFSFGGGGILGDLSLVYDPTRNIYTTQGKSYYVRKVRNGVTMGYDSTGQDFVNSLPVDFVPTTMNSQGLVLGAVVVDSFFFGYTKFLIYDPATRTQTDLPMRASRFFGPGQFRPPVALNHRTIAVIDSSGQTTFKESPQIVGPSGAIIWEEDLKTGQYVSQYLNLLIPVDSGWNLTEAKDINDNGAIICTGTFNGQVHAALLVPFGIAKASIRDGEFVVDVPNLNASTTGTLDLFLKVQNSSTEQVTVKTLTNQGVGRIVIRLDDVMNQASSPLDTQNGKKFDRVAARWRAGGLDITSGDMKLDVYAVEVLGQRKISNYFSPTWGGTWGGTTLQKGVYAAGTFPSGLINVSRQTEFLNALDPQNEGLAMDGDTVIRDHVQLAQAGFNQVIYLNGSDRGYIEKPDRDQDNASSPTLRLLRTTSVAVRTNADRLVYNDEVYIPSFSVRTVDDSGTLHGNVDQIDVWRGQGDQTLQNAVDNFGIATRTCLKILKP